MNRPVVRSLVGVFAGVVVCFVLIVLFEQPANRLHPLPPGTDVNDRDQLGEHVRNAPLAAMLWVLAAYAVGPFVGAYLAARVAGRGPLVHAGIIAGLFFVASVLNLLLVPGHPAWFAVANLSLFAPIAWLAARLARPHPPSAKPEMIASK